MIKKLLYLTVLAILLISSGCSKNDKPKITSDDIIEQITGSDQLQLKNEWVRVSGEGMNTALFFDAVNGTAIADTILSAESEIAQIVEIHETYKMEGDMMGMRQVDFVAVPPNSTIQFKPRDLHIMLIKLKQDINLGDSVKAVINFKHAGKIKLIAIAKELMMNKK